MSLQIGDLIPLQGLTKEDKKKLVDIVNKAEANQSIIKTNIINSLNNKLKTALKTDSSWIDIQNAIIPSNCANYTKGILKGNEYNYSLNTGFKARVISLTKGDDVLIWCYPKAEFDHYNNIAIWRYDTYVSLQRRYSNQDALQLDGYSWEAWGI
ncbi:hypothetical protein FDC10_11750 [Clostridium botulinum]|nr:hypothetical protein [Clostridium botulinum]